MLVAVKRILVQPSVAVLIARCMAVLAVAAGFAVACYGEQSGAPDVAPVTGFKRPPSNALIQSETRRSSSSTIEIVPPIPAAAETFEDLPPGNVESESPASDESGTFTKEEIAATNRQAEILLRAARNSVAMGDISEALARFEKLLWLVPRKHEARFEYAGLLLQAGRLSESRRQLERLVAEKEHVGDYRLALADLLLRLKEYKAARAQLRGLLGDERLGHLAAIKIARSFVLDDRLLEARRFFDKHVSNLRGLDTTTEIALAQLLIEMQRPAEAVRVLTPLHDANLADETVSATLLLALVQMNARLDALQFIGKLEQQSLKDSGIWLELAARLYQEQAFPEALALYQQAWRRHPEQPGIALRVARSHLRLYEVERAKKILDRCRDDPNGQEFSTVLIDYHTLVGEYADAISLAKRRLQADAGDLPAAILLGDAYHASLQFTAAEAAYATALKLCTATDKEQHREILRLQAKNYLRSRRFEQSIAILNALLKERPTDVGSRILLIETLTEMKCYDAAAALARATVDGESVRDRFALRAQLGNLLLKQGRWAEAAQQFRSLAEASDRAPPEVAYGLYRTATMLGQPEVADNAFRLGPSPLAPAATWGVVFAGRAMAYSDCHSAAAALDDALQSSPRNIVLLNMRGEAAQLCDGSCGRADCDCGACVIQGPLANVCDANPSAANGWFQSALQMSPANIRARLGCARTLNKQMAYDCAYAEYLALLELMPNDVNLTRETARMVEGWLGLERASAFYEERQSAATREKEVETTAAQRESSDVVGKRTSAVGAESEPMLFGQLLATEFQTKYLRGWRQYQAITEYERLIEMEPSNDSAIFGLAQSQSALNRTQCAINTYERLLEANPCHQDASVALLRNQLEIQPKVLTTVDYENQLGRQGLANMTWLNVSLSSRRPLGDENEFFEWGYRERFLQPTDDRADLGEIPFFRWQQKYSSDSLVFAEVAVEKYQYGLKTRPTFTAGLDILKRDDFEVRFSGFLKNYYVCGEAIRQDIYTTGIQIDGIFRPRRLWTLTGYYRLANFSDNNWVNWVNLNSSHILLEGRKQIRGLIDYNFYTFAQQTVFGPIPGSLVGTIHPYWSPSGYSFTTAGLEWKHWLSRDKFKGANEHFYSLFSGAAVDSNGIGYFVANGRWQRDVSESFTWTVDFNLIRSQNQVYNAVGVTTNGVWRLW